MIQFTCPTCDKQLRAPLAAAGKTGKCNGCSTPVKVPQTRQKVATHQQAVIAKTQPK